MRARNPDPKPRRGREGEECQEVRGLRSTQVLYLLSQPVTTDTKTFKVLCHECIEFEQSLKRK